MRNFPRFLLPTFTAALFLFIAAVGVAKALSQFQTSLKSDPAYHNLIVTSTDTAWEFIKMAEETSQPILDYALRRILYFPLFGESERTIKLPSFLSWVFILLLAPLLTFRGLKKEREKKEVFMVLIATAAISLWIANLPILVGYASEGRHYEWCALISLLWFSAYHQPGYFKSIRFHFLTLVYLSSHFFVWPLVGSAYLYRLVGLLQKRKQNKELLFCAMLIGVIFLISASINWIGIKALLNWNSSMGISKQSSIMDVIRGGSVSGFGLFRMFRSVFEIKYMFILIALLGSVAFRQSRKFLFSFAGLFLTLLAISCSSSLAFLPRYLIPFFGFAWMTAMEATSALLEGIRRNERAVSLKVPWLRRTVVLVSSLMVLVLVYKASPIATLRSAFDIGIPQENFSDEFFEYEKIKALNTPSMVIGKGKYPYTLTLWYLRDQSKESPHVSSVSQDVYHVNTWKKSWAEFKEKNPAGKTFVHFYTESLCGGADPKIFRELKRFSEGCIGEIPAADSVGELEEVFLGSRG